MTDIYVASSVAGMPDAADQLAHLIDTGHQLILLGDQPPAIADALPGARLADVLPATVAPGSWLVSDDPSVCGDRTRGLQTLLVGPRVAAAPRPGQRCDAEARNLASAVLEILGREVMG